MGFDSDLRSLIKSIPGGGVPAGAQPGAGDTFADAAEELGMPHAAKIEQRLQHRKLQLQSRGMSAAGASQVAAGRAPSNPVDALMVGNALGKPPSAGPG
jgi:hypothetical protein